ncbi:YbaK/EbsC family protein [Candidatus Bathyarchaeota archaeon]|nr:YbaK/EbsC family protein [Candidatus Bathyarchaeota archaeon]
MSCESFSSESLKKRLESIGVNAVFLRFEEHTMTVDAAAKQLGVSRERIIKSLLFVDDAGLPVLAIVTGDKRVDEAKLAAACNAKNVRRATPEEVKRFTGYNVGAVPPVGHERTIRTIIDEKVLQFDRVIGGGGDVNMLLEISPSDIRRLTNSQIKNISK